MSSRSGGCSASQARASVRQASHDAAAPGSLRPKAHLGRRAGCLGERRHPPALPFGCGDERGQPLQRVRVTEQGDADVAVEVAEAAGAQLGVHGIAVAAVVVAARSIPPGHLERGPEADGERGGGPAASRWRRPSPSLSSSPSRTPSPSLSASPASVPKRCSPRALRPSPSASSAASIRPSPSLSARPGSVMPHASSTASRSPSPSLSASSAGNVEASGAGVGEAAEVAGTAVTARARRPPSSHQRHAPAVIRRLTGAAADASRRPRWSSRASPGWTG